MGVLDTAVNDCIAHGVGVVLCLEDSFDVAAYAPTALLGSGTSSAIWQSRLTVLSNVAAHVAANWTPAQVCIEPFDEPPAPSGILVNTWPQYQATLYSAARAAAPNHTLLLTEPDYSAIADLVAVDPTIYDVNTKFVVHTYLPFIFAQQGLQNGYNTWVNGLLNWPPDSSQKTTAIASMTSNVNADASVPSGSKASVIASQTTELNNFFGVPEGKHYLNQQFDLLVAWCAAYGIAPARVFMTEFGTTRTNSGGFGGSAFTGVPATSRSAWKIDMLALMDARGFCHCEFALDDPRYGITDGTGTAIGTINV